MTQPRNRRHWLALGLFALAASLWTFGCEQSEGERCQRTSDCPSSLVCNIATQTCSNDSTSGQFDAQIIDGPRPDAAIDAVDAPPDAPPDI